jgi:hypothetical protein
MNSTCFSGWVSNKWGYLALANFKKVSAKAILV